MNIKQYIKMQSVNRSSVDVVRELSISLGVSESTVHKWALGDRVPKRTRWAKIEKITGGLVKAIDYIYD